VFLQADSSTGNQEVMEAGIVWHDLKLIFNRVEILYFQKFLIIYFLNQKRNIKIN